MELPLAYKSLLSLNNSKIVLLDEEMPIDLDGMKKAIVFIMAKWSGSSQHAFRPLAKTLSEISDLDALVLYIADTDHTNAETFFARVGDSPRGAGETYWILNGNVIKKLAGHKEDSLPLVKQYTEELLAAV